MRRLGKGQSVKFFVPVDIDQGIKAVRSQYDDYFGASLGATNVLRWAISKTCSDLENSFPHWNAQHRDYQNCQCTWERFICSKGDHLDELRKYWLQPEAKMLEEMYGSLPREESSRPALMHIHLDEEQEREVNVEVEQESLIERPPQVEPAKHELSQAVRQLVSHGQILQNSAAFVCLFEVLGCLCREPATYVDPWTKKVIATKDFINTISPVNGSDYIRPINWILTLNKNALGNGSSTRILLSPFEVNKLLPSIHGSKFVHLHMYSPRVMRNCISFDALTFYTIPTLSSSWTAPDPGVVMQLNLMAGQLYLPDFAVYAQLLEFLGLVSRTYMPTESMPAEITGDGFVPPNHCHGRMRDICPFQRNPIPFVDC